MRRGSGQRARSSATLTSMFSPPPPPPYKSLCTRFHLLTSYFVPLAFFTLTLTCTLRQLGSPPPPKGMGFEGRAKQGRGPLWAGVFFCGPAHRYALDQKNIEENRMYIKAIDEVHLLTAMHNTAQRGHIKTEGSQKKDISEN